MPLTLLVVDDDAVDREAVRRTLRAARVDATVIEADSADAAFARLRAGPVDCILLDYRLPGTDGLAVLRQLADDGIDTPVVALTGQGDEQIAVDVMKAGAVDYLSKQSLTPDRLDRSLRHALTVAAAERERRELLAREKAAREEAQAANRAKDEFLATLSHELRTPLNAIVGWAHMLTSGQVDADTLARGLDTIQRNAQLQVKLIDDLLDISRIVTGKMTLEREPLSLGTIVTSAVESHLPAAAAAGITLTLNSSGVERPVFGDGARLQQVVTNLLSNALKFTPEGGTIEVTLTYETDRVHLAIRDSGIGIDPMFLPHVFERFRQADSSPSRRHLGLGLGLAIVNHLVQLHGGRVIARSEGPGRGATFVVEIPTTTISAQDLSDGAAPIHDLAGLSVLVVDDDRDGRDLLAAVLRRHGAEVRAAASADEAVTLASAAWPDVLLSDLAMPNEDGFSLLRRLRLANHHRPLVAAAITAFASADDRARSLASGFQAHIAKPFDTGELVALVWRLGRAAAR